MSGLLISLFLVPLLGTIPLAKKVFFPICKQNSPTIETLTPPPCHSPQKKSYDCLALYNSLN